MKLRLKDTPQSQASTSSCSACFLELCPQPISLHSITQEWHLWADLCYEDQRSFSSGQQGFHIISRPKVSNCPRISSGIITSPCQEHCHPVQRGATLQSQRSFRM